MERHGPETLCLTKCRGSANNCEYHPKQCTSCFGIKLLVKITSWLGAIGSRNHGKKYKHKCIGISSSINKGADGMVTPPPTSKAKGAPAQTVTDERLGVLSRQVLSFAPALHKKMVESPLPCAAFFYQTRTP
jgi:hypothetical protein